MTYKIPLALLMFGVLSAQIPETLFEDGNKAISKIFGECIIFVKFLVDFI